MCQLPRPPYEIHKMIYLRASVKIFKNKMKIWETDKSYFHFPHWAKRNNKLRKFLFKWFQQFVCLDYSSSHFSIYVWQNLKTEGRKPSYNPNMAHPAWLLDAVGKLKDCNWYLLPHLIHNFQIKQKHLKILVSSWWIEK